MATPSRPSLPLRRQSSTRSLRHDNDDLAQSLKQLSISTSPGRAHGSPHLSEPSTPFRASGRRTSQSPRPNARLPSRSPSQGRDPGSGTPTLLRKASMNSLRSSNGMGAVPTPTRRASTTHIMSPSPKSPLATPPVQEKPRPTASSIAHDVLSAELQAHHSPECASQPQTIVVLNDAVYGHRFSRPRTSRAALGTIVERPERIKAAVLGISTAYVRLGGRHSEGAFPPHPRRDVEDLPGIPFRIHKTERKLSLLSPAVVNVHGTKWMEELKMMCEAAESKLAMGGKELQRPELNRGTEKAPEKFHEGDLYLCSESLNAMEGALGAVCEAIDTVFGPGPQRAFVGVRPPGHHCSASYPSGFCWINNVHVGIMHAVLNHGLTHAAIIDFDLHHGDGSQAITWQHNTRANAAAKNAAAWKKSSVGYFSLHDINSYPCEMGDEEKVKNASICVDNAHGQTVWNVHLQSWKTEEEFWRLYETKYSVLLEKTRNYLKNQSEQLRQSNQVPKAAIFFSAGFDASEWESAGMQRHQVNVPTEFYARIAHDVIKLAAEEGLEVDGRIISVLEGGYSDKALFSGILSHLSGLADDQTYEREPQNLGRLGAEMGHKIGVLAEEDDEMDTKPSLDSVHSYDPAWWASPRLDELEAIVAGPGGPAAKPHSNTLPTYFSPTQASTARVADPIKMRRSLSNLGASLSRPASPPPPEVPWTVAAHELSKLLIPESRQTDSCKPEDLNAEATRARRDRQSLLLGIDPNPPAPASRPTSRMSLRERRPKPAPPPPQPTKDKAPKGRRQTMATTTLTADKASAVARGIPSRTNSDEPVRRASRRLSEVPTTLASRATSQTSSSNEADLPEGSEAPGPGSPVSTRAPPGGGLQVKKTRNPVAPRKEPAPRAPRGTKKVAPPTTSRPPTAAQRVHPSTKPQARAGPSGATGDDIDSITTGMKKIRINLITQSQKEARERARLEAEKVKARSVSASAAISQSKPARPIEAPADRRQSPEIRGPDSGNISPTQVAGPNSEIPTPPATISSSGLTTPFPDAPFEMNSEPQQVSLPPSSSPIPSVSIQSSDDDNVFIAYQPEGPAPVAVAQQEPIKWLPPNVQTPSSQTPAATPSPVKKNNLFQYTEGIPFAPRPQQHAGEQKPTDEGAKSEPPASKSVQEIPETPQH
ncbi:histone deacetylase [Fusarium solani]